MRKESLLIFALYIAEFFLLTIVFGLFIFIITGCKKEHEIPLSIPHVLTLDQVNEITSNSAVCGGKVTTTGGSKVTERGICWDTLSNPTISTNIEKNGSDTGVFVCNLKGLKPSVKYYFRAYASNSVGTAYGDEITFTTSLFSLPVISTIPVTDIVETTASSGGNISYDGNAFITKRGVCWNTSPNPTIANNKTADGSGKVDFTSKIAGLTGSTVYYLRSYATNAAGTAYGEEISFTTLAVALPKVSTVAVTTITPGNAQCGGSIDMGTTVVERGICWSTKHLPTITDNKTSDGSGTGSFTSSLTKLASKTAYYVRAYAKNSVGIAYGNEVSFISLNTGNVTYTLAKDVNPTAEQLNAYQLIKVAMDSAMYYYNTYTTIIKNITVYYVPSVPTADGSNNGTIRFGSNTYYMNVGTAMHETAHTVGVGTNGSWSNLMVGGVYQGINANNVLRSITGNSTDQIHGDTQHFWPYGINYPTEVTSASVLINHCKILEAMKSDGL